MPATGPAQTESGAYSRPVSPYELTVQAQDDAVLAVLSGELDLTNAPELETRLGSAAPAGSLLVLDLNAVEFLDSAVLHVLFRLARARGAEGLVIVVAPHAPAAGTLSLVGLDRVATVRPSLETPSPEQ